MNYKSYKLARDLAWEMLIWEGVHELPVDVIKISKGMGISVVYGKEFMPDEEGFCTIVKGKPYIVINPELTRQTERFTVAHEFGHILLGHVGQYHSIFKKNDVMYSNLPHEQEANIFATRLLAPACVLLSCNARTPEEIMKLCDISGKEAEARAERIKELAKKGRIATLPMERMILEQFKEFIYSQQGSSPQGSQP